MATVYVGMLAPYALRFTGTPGTDAYDLSTVTAALFKVKKPNGTIASWTATLSAQSSSSVLIAHAYQAGDLDQAGCYTYWVEATVPSGTINFGPSNFCAVDPLATTDCDC